MARNKKFAIAVAAGILALIVVVFVYAPKRYSGEQPMRIAGQTVYVSIADTESSRELGLGGRTGLASDEGMLFIFPQEGKYPFWMKDMKFSIDILWLSNDGTVVYVQPDVSPETYPKSFGPDTLARYVLEVPAGYTTEHHITVGEKASI